MTISFDMKVASSQWESAAVGEERDAVSDRWIPIVPTVLDDRECRLVLRRCARKLASARTEASLAKSISEIRADAVDRARNIRGRVTAPLIACIHVICDLRAQGWQFRVARAGIAVRAPVPGSGPVAEEKARVRTAHLIERDSQLAGRSVRSFIRSLERPRIFKGEWSSVFSLMRDGRALADALRSISALPEDADRLYELQRVVDPYVQVVRAGVSCDFTGLKLSEIWRYFRHTWTTTYQSTPGRKLHFIIRDRAAANHPVVGIGALGSAIVQLSVRDEWIGWTGERFIQNLIQDPTTSWTRWILDSLSTLIDGLFLDDLLNERIITRADLTAPSEAVISALREFSGKERRTHHLYPDRGQHKRNFAKRDADDTSSWEAQAETHLFRSKRTHALAELLDARRKLLNLGLRKGSVRHLRRVLNDRDGIAAIHTVVRHVKARHVGVDMMDITVCGAIPPYNEILGGKLVSLLMTSPDVISAYQDQYRGSASVIASSMAGSPVRRLPHLVFLGTTSLYGIGASQYNRIRVAATDVGGTSDAAVAFVALGKTVGYGSYHFSRDTMEAFDVVLRRQQRGRPVNSIFGEGVNPKLRKVRAALDEIGLPSDLLLQHGSARIVYGIPLAENFREILLGRSRRPKYVLPQKPEITDALAGHWRSRWLNRRINRPGILDAIAVHTLAHPIRHGARVVLPTDPEEIGPLFAPTA